MSSGLGTRFGRGSVKYDELLATGGADGCPRRDGVSNVSANSFVSLLALSVENCVQVDGG